jgi:hypothetical protein
MAWVNAPLVVYHGTDDVAAPQIIIRIDLARASPFDVDFGPGFYVTSNLDEARYWADLRAISTSNRATVMGFDLDRDEVARLGDHLAFVLPDNAFHDFVDYNRRGHPHHARRITPTAPYDVVYGSVSSYPDRTHQPDWDQICFLTPNAVSCLKTARVEDYGAPLFTSP